MELFKQIRLKIGTSLLANKLVKTKRKVYYSGIDLVKTIGIVWDASRTGEFACLSRFYQKMHERNIEVKILGYYPERELPNQYTAIRFLTCFKRPELNFFYHPLSGETNSFIKKRFDILIDINFKKLFPLYYVSSLSDAAFKIGLYEDKNQDTPFDLMMEMKSPVDVDYYLTQAVQYLEMINSGAVKQYTN